jgi:thioredoxin reductase (NADPH)
MCGYGPVVVVGGGNSAGQAALALAEHALRVHLLVRGGDLTANMSRYLADRIERSPRVEVRCRTEVSELVGGAALDAVIVQNTETGLREKLDAVAMFVFIGAVPGTQWLAGRLTLDDHGFVRTGPDVLQPEDDEATQLRMPLLQTSLPGVFAAGDVRRGSARRVASAVGEGAMAVRLIHEYLERPGPAGDRT